jgi:hypothetical protein
VANGLNPQLDQLADEASGQRRSLAQTTPPKPITDFIAGMFDPVLSAGDYLGGIMQGSQRPNWHDTIAAGAGLASMAVPGPAEEAGAVRGAERVAEGAARYLTPEGLAIKGDPYSKAQRATLEQLAREPKGTGPLNLASQAEIPGVPQTPLERYDPPRGVSGRLQRALANPAVRAGVKESIDEGVRMGAHRWYHTEPVRQGFAEAYKGSNSDPGGARAFKQFMDLAAGTSVRSDVPTNIRNASYYHYLQQQGLPLPEGALPYPYGHVAQRAHRQHFTNLSAAAAEGREGWDVLRNPKPPSYSQNLQGNLAPGTIDTHAFRNIAMRSGDPEFLGTSVRVKLKKGTGEVMEDSDEAPTGDAGTLMAKYGERSVDKDGNTIVTYRPQKLFRDKRLTMEEAQKIPTFWASKPNANEYAATEDFYRALGLEHELKLPLADAQAAAWAGGGKLTGLGSPPTKTFAEMLNERAEFTARMRGADPTQTLHQAMRGELPLLGLGGLAAGAAAARQQQQQTPDQQQF